MDRTRATEIIAAYGADAARWPADERGPLRELVAGDPALRRAVAEAAKLDAMLCEWATDGPADDAARAVAAADAAIARAGIETGRLRPQRLLPVALGGSIAAALVAAVLLSPPEGAKPDAAPVAAAQSAEAMQLAAAEDDSEIWSMMFTPTPDEESFL